MKRDEPVQPAGTHDEPAQPAGTQIPTAQPASMQVRPAQPEDAHEVARVHVRTWQSAYAGIVPAGTLAALDDQLAERASRMRERWSDPTAPQFTTLVAADPAVLGFVTYGPYRTGDGDDQVDPSVGEVLAIYVDPEHQGRGAGRALLDAAVAALINTNAYEVRLWVMEQNGPSRHFYEQYGFAPDGQRHMFRVRQPDGTGVDLPEVRYALALR